METEPMITLPRRAYKDLALGFLMSEAGEVLRDAIHAGSGSRVTHLGAPFGTVFASVWRNDQDEAMMFLAEYLWLRT